MLGNTPEYLIYLNNFLVQELTSCEKLILKYILYSNYMYWLVDSTHNSSSHLSPKTGILFNYQA